MKGRREAFSTQVEIVNSMATAVYLLYYRSAIPTWHQF